VWPASIAAMAASRTNVGVSRSGSPNQSGMMSGAPMARRETSPMRWFSIPETALRTA